MIKNTLKIFFKNLIYLFVAMGIIYLFTIIAIFTFVVSTVSNAGTLINDSLALVQSSVENSEAAVKDFLTYSVDRLDMSGNIFDIIYRIIKTNWLQETVMGFLETLNVSTEGFNSQLGGIINQFADSLKLDFYFSVTQLIVGIICASYATRFVLRRKNAKRNVKKYLIARFIEPLLLSAIILLALFILSLLKSFAFLVYIAFFAVFAVLSLSSSWIIHRDGSVKFKDVVNVKNTVLFLVSVFLILLIVLAFSFVLIVISIPLAILIMVPCAVYTLNIVGVSSDSFVCGLIKQD